MKLLIKYLRKLIYVILLNMPVQPYHPTNNFASLTIYNTYVKCDNIFTKQQIPKFPSDTL